MRVWYFGCAAGATLLTCALLTGCGTHSGSVLPATSSADATARSEGTLAVAATTAATAVPGTPSSAGTDPRPGPDILYASAATPPQLSNAGIWEAAPILVSGASAYRSGEYLYQDYLYDDHGANGTVPDPTNSELTATVFARFSGTYTYPTSASYGGNAADLVEFRMKPTSSATAFRVTFNTMIDPDVVAFTIGLGTSTTSYAMPHGANASEPAELFLTVHGGSADVVEAATGKAVGTTAPTVEIDRTRRQFTVLLPYTTFDPRNDHELRVAIAAGLWNSATGKYLLPGTTASATAPGGSGALTAPAAFFNVGFRHAEPAVGSGTPTNATTYWRESAQSAALANGNLSSFFDLVDMTKLAAGANDDMHGEPQGVPVHGHMDRILASHFEPFQGRLFTSCNGVTAACSPEFGNALQPYAVYVPVESTPSEGYPLTLLLHSLSANYNQYQNTNNEKEFGERDGGSLVFTTEGRGPDNWYYNLAEAEVFEVWADVTRHYRINQNSVALTGYSMGGYATFKLAVLFPDLFAKLQPTVGPTYVAGGNGNSTDTKLMFATLRNLPLLSWHASADELVPTPDSLEEESTLSKLGLNFEWDLFSPAEHLTLALNDQFAPAATFLGIPQNNVNPPHVTFVRNPTMDDATHQAIADHAYWVSNVATRSASTVTGTIDVLSGGFGVGDPPTTGTTAVAGTLTGGNLAPLAYTGFRNGYGTPVPTRVTDTLVITATNIASATINPKRARVDCGATLNVTSDGPLKIMLAGCSNGTRTFSTTPGRAPSVPR